MELPYTSKKGLFHLPREIRDQVYSYVVHANEAYDPPNHGTYFRINVPYDEDDLTRYFLRPAIFRVNSQMRQEARIATLTVNSFHVVSLGALQWLLETIGYTGRIYLRSLFLHRPVFYWRCPHNPTPDICHGMGYWKKSEKMPGDVTRVIALLKECQRLRVLEIEFTCGELDDQLEVELRHLNLLGFESIPPEYGYMSHRYRRPERRYCHQELCSASDGIGLRLADVRQLTGFSCVSVHLFCVCVSSTYEYSNKNKAQGNKLEIWLGDMLKARNKTHDVHVYDDSQAGSTNHITIYDSSNNVKIQDSDQLEHMVSQGSVRTLFKRSWKWS